MKKFVICFTVLAVLLSAHFAYSDSIPPHFRILNILKLSGGNDAVYVRHFDYTNRDFDIWEKDGKLNEDDNAIAVLSQKWASKRAAKNSRPTAKNGLLNADSPVEITAYGNKLTLSGWGGEGLDGIRLLDSRGKVLFEDSTKNKAHHDFVIEVPSLPATYFIELESRHTIYSRTPTIGLGPLSIPVGKGINAETAEYCYVQLRLEAGREKKAYAGSQKANEEVVDAVKNQILTWAIMKKNNFSGVEEMTKKMAQMKSEQVMEMMSEFDEKDTHDYSIARSVAENFVKEHNILGIHQLTDIKDSDYSAMADEYLTRLNADGKAPVRKAPARRKRK